MLVTNIEVAIISATKMYYRACSLLYHQLDFDCGVTDFVPTGAGIYVSSGQLSYSSSSLPNNSIITIYTGYVGYSSTYRRLAFYCCSNSTSGYTGSFLGLNGNSYSGRITVQDYNSSHIHAGCIYLYLDKLGNSYSQNWLSSSEQGIYTCRMPDSTGRNIDVSVGIYRHGYASRFLLLCMHS